MFHYLTARIVGALAVLLKSFTARQEVASPTIQAVQVRLESQMQVARESQSHLHWCSGSVRRLRTGFRPGPLKRLTPRADVGFSACSLYLFGYGSCKDLHEYYALRVHSGFILCLRRTRGQNVRFVDRGNMILKRLRLQSAIRPSLTLSLIHPTIATKFRSTRILYSHTLACYYIA